MVGCETWLDFFLPHVISITHSFAILAFCLLVCSNLVNFVLTFLLMLEPPLLCSVWQNYLTCTCNLIILAVTQFFNLPKFREILQIFFYRV
jgi:hypothetical protein